MASQFLGPPLSAGVGGIGSGLYNLFGGGGKNPADAAMSYLNQIPGQTQQYFDPYFQAGKNALPSLQDQYSALLGNPGGKLNEIGGGFQKSPGFDFAMQQALASLGRNQAAGGMYGSPQHEQWAMNTATGLANQDYYNWLNQATGLYNQGLSGQQGMAQMGQQAGKSMADIIAQQLAQQAQLQYAGQASQNQAKGSAFENIFGGIGSLLSAFL